MKTYNLLAAFLIGAIFSLPVSAKMYKWVDENGVTHYGETIPPKYADKDRTEMESSGRTIKKDVLSPEELRSRRAAKEQSEVKKREDVLIEIEKQRRDQMLINTYSNIGEIDLARDRNLQQVELRINGINSQIKMANDNLTLLHQEADGYTAAGKPIPPSLQEDMQLTQARIEKLKKDLEKPIAEKAALVARYEEDKARYRELTGK